MSSACSEWEHVPKPRARLGFAINPAGQMPTSEISSESSLTVFTNELLLIIFQYLGPRSVIRFGQTCTGYHELVDYYKSTRNYGEVLARGALIYLRKSLIESHTGRCKHPGRTLEQKVESYAFQMATALAMCPTDKPLCTWSTREMLYFLYPMVTRIPIGWMLAPYAYEWCARFEKRILQSSDGDQDCRPRRNLLSLIHHDPFQRLVPIARQMEWDMGHMLMAVITAASGAVSSQTTLQSAIGVCTDVLRQSLKLATSIDQIEFCLAVMTAGFKISLQAFPLADQGTPKLGNTAPWCALGIGLPLGAEIGGDSIRSEVSDWLELTGLENSASDSPERSPLKMMKKFSCNDGVPVSDSFGPD